MPIPSQVSDLVMNRLEQVLTRVGIRLALANQAWMVSNSSDGGGWVMMGMPTSAAGVAVLILPSRLGVPTQQCGKSMSFSNSSNGDRFGGVSTATSSSPRSSLALRLTLNSTTTSICACG